MNQHPAAAARHGQPPGSGVADGSGERGEAGEPAEPGEPGVRRVGGPGGGEVPQLGWPVGLVSGRLGIAAPTLRSWDRRHGVGPSLRTSGNHRRYTELDIRRVLLMSRLTAQGLPAQSAADAVLAMDVRSIAARLADEDVEGSVAGGGADAAADDAADSLEDWAVGAADAADVVEAIVGAARALDARTMGQLYRQALRRRDVGQAWVDVFAPALRRVGDLWAEGRIGVQAEHLASELLQSELRAVVRANRLRVSGPPIVLASADDEQHHLPLLALEAELARNGAAGLFLGPRVPAEALVAALRETRPRALFLWASLARSGDEPLWRGLHVVDWPLEVVIGGPGWPAGIVVPEGPVGLTRVADFSSAVRTLVSSPGGLAR